MELLCCGYPQHNANYGDPEVPTSRKPTTQQRKTVVLWVFWTLALVGHRKSKAFVALARIASFAEHLTVESYTIIISLQSYFYYWYSITLSL